MNDLDEFAVVALALFVALTLLIWLLTYLEQTLIQPITERGGLRRDQNPISAAPPDNN